MFYNILTTSINNTRNGKIRKPFAVPKQFPRESSKARPILQTLGVIHAIQWALCHCDPVKSESALLSVSKTSRLGRHSQGVVMERSGNALLNLGTR
jgi:hypothetical protein